MTYEFADRIGPVEARWLISRISAMGDPKRLALFESCAAKCPPGKNKRRNKQQKTLGWVTDRRAA